MPQIRSFRKSSKKWNGSDNASSGAKNKSRSMLLRWILGWLSGNDDNELQSHDADQDNPDDTRVIIVLNSDYVRTVQGVDTLDELTQLTLTPEEQSRELDAQNTSTAPGRIALRLKHFQDSRVSILGHVNHNLLSFLVNVLLSHKVKGLIMLKKTTDDLSLIDPASLVMEDRMQLATTKQILKDEYVKSQIDPDSQEIFAYEPSRAERTFLEERF